MIGVLALQGNFSSHVKVLGLLGHNSKLVKSPKDLDDIDGDNIKKTGRLLTLDYTETEMLKQIYASRVENVNPFLIVYYSGDMEISPDSLSFTNLVVVVDITSSA